MDATAKYYKLDLTGKVNNCLSCSLEKIRQKNIPKKNEDKSENSGERMNFDISSMRKPSMGGRRHWVMLVDEATEYKKSFLLKKKNEQVEPFIDWIKALKPRHEIQVKIIRCDNAGENKVLERESDKSCPMADVPCLDHQFECYWVCPGDRQTKLPQAKLYHLPCFRSVYSCSIMPGSPSGRLVGLS